jgi:hypothetical protein
MSGPSPHSGHILLAFTASSQGLQAAVPDRCGSVAVMDNVHQPPGGDPQDYWPTQELGPSAGEPGPGSGQPGPGRGQRSGQPGQPGPGWRGPWPPAGAPTPPSPPRRYGRALWWGAALALVALLAGGGFAAAELSSSAASVPSGPTGQAAQLNAVLSSVSSPDSAATASSLGATTSTTAQRCLRRAEKARAAGHPFAAWRVRRLCGHPLRRLRLLGGIHGEFTFESKTGPRTLAYERGVIQSVSGSDVVVQAKDGTTWTWILQSNTVIRENHEKTTSGALSNGEHVFVGGPVVSGGYDARLFVIVTNSGSSPSAGSTPTPSASPASGS